MCHVDGLLRPVPLPRRAVWQDIWICAPGLLCTGSSNRFGWIVFLPERVMQLNGESVEANYSTRDGKGRNGKTTGGYKGKYIIILLELDGQAGDNAKYGVQLENCGPVTKVGDRLKDVKVESKVKTLRRYREAKAAAGLK